MRYKLFPLWLVAILASCASKKDIIYFQDAEAYDDTVFENTKVIIQPNDILSVTVETLLPEMAIPYNKQQGGNGLNGQNIELLKLQGYLVDVEGQINFPVLGKIPMAGKELRTAESDLEKRLDEEGHLVSPKVTIRILNAKVTVLGEVQRPGTYGFTEQFITLPQALGYAGDLTINGKRDDILLIRQVNGKRQMYTVDLTSADWLNDPIFNIRQNDVIVVNANRAKVKTAGLVGNAGTVLTIASLLLSSVIILTR